MEVLGFSKVLPKKSLSLSLVGVFIGVNLPEMQSGSEHVSSIALSSGSDGPSSRQRINEMDVRGRNWSHPVRFSRRLYRRFSWIMGAGRRRAGWGLGSEYPIRTGVAWTSLLL